jgi:hypothetical protein
MIYILKQSKGKKKEERYTVSFEEAISFLVEITNYQLKTNDWFILGSDKPEEIQGLREYFIPEFFSLEEGMIGINVYRIKEVKKSKRVKNKVISHKSIEGFSEKIKKALNLNQIGFTINSKSVEFRVQDYGKLKIDANVLLNHNLVIQSIEISKPSTYEEIDSMKKAINTVLTKQRYYYKRKQTK